MPVSASRIALPKSYKFRVKMTATLAAIIPFVFTTNRA
jgi:hypothetical protein